MVEMVSVLPFTWCIGRNRVKRCRSRYWWLKQRIWLQIDTYHNTSTPNASAKAKADPSSVAGGGAFGAFVTTDSYGVASTYTSSSAADNAAKKCSTNK